MAHSYVWVILINEYSFLPTSELLSLALLRSTIKDAVMKQINNTCYFKIPYGHQMRVLAPNDVLLHTLTSLSPSLANTTCIRFSDSFNEPLINLPSSITHIKFGRSFNQVPTGLPNSLTHIVLGCDLNQDCTNLHSVAYMGVIGSFSPPIDALPPSLLRLNIESCVFNGPADNLPSTLTYLHLPGNFNHPIDHLPHSLTHLQVPFSFNQAIDSLPSSLTCLMLGECFNKPLDHLPHSLIHLEVTSMQLDYPVDHLPHTLTNFSLGVTNYYEHKIDFLPPHQSPFED